MHFQSFRRKKYVRQRLSPIDGGEQNQQLTPRPATTEAPGAPVHANAKAQLQEQPNGSPDSQNDIDEDDDDDEEIARLQRFHASLSSDDKVKRWIATYEDEKQQFASFAVFTEVKLDEIQDAYVTIMGRPNAVEVAACFASLVKMPGIVGCYKSLLEKLAVGIHSAIYCPAPQIESMLDQSEAATSLVSPPLASSQQPMAALVQGFFDQKTYFARASELEKQLFANRCISDARVLRSVTEDEVTRFFIQVPIQQLKTGLAQLAACAVSSSNGTKFDELFLFMKDTHAEQKRQLLQVRKSILEDEDDAYPFFIPLASSAQICRAIAHSAASFSTSGKEMILCSILEFLDVDSFKDIFKRFDAHGKALFLHHLSIMESSDHLQCIVEQLPNAGEMLFRFYLVSCGAQGDPTSLTKQVFFQKVLGAEMEYFFLCDLAAYINEEQFLLLSKEYEKNVLERKRRQRNRRRSAVSNGEGQEFGDDFEDEDEDDGGASGARQRSVKLSIENFQLMIWNFLHHHRLSSAQVLSIIAAVLLPSLEEKERALLIDYCLDHFPLDGRWSQVFRIVDEMEAECSTSLTVAGSMATRVSDGKNNGSSMDNVTANVHEIRIKLLKKLFAMLSREERESWLDKMNAKYPTEAMKKKIQSLKQEASKKAVVVTAPQPIPPSLDDPKAHIPQMKMELKMLWMECLLEAITNDKEYSARMAMLRQVLQPFLDGKIPSQGGAQTKASIATIEKNINQLLGQLTAADKAKLLLKLAPPQPRDEKPRVDRSSSPIPELREEPPTPTPQPALPTSNPEILAAFQTLLACKSEECVLQILRNALIVDENAPPQTEPNGKHSHTLSSEMKWKLSAVVAVAEPMEWQKYVKLGSVDVGCQTTLDLSEMAPTTLIESPTINTNSAQSRSSVLPNKMAPLTLSSLLGKAAGSTSPRKKENNKYQKINSAAVPRSIGGLVTSWRMNTDQLSQFAKKSLSVVLKIIADAYGEMLTAGRRKTNLPYAPMRGRELSLAQIVYQQFLHSYGLPGIADMHLLAFSCAIEMYRTQHLRVEYFVRYCFEEVPKSELANYIEFLECIVCDDVNVAGGNTKGGQQQQQQAPSKRLRGGFVPRIVVPDRENWTIGVDKAQEAAQLCFRAMRKNSVVAFCDRLVAIAAMGSTSSIVSPDASNSVTTNSLSSSTATQSASELVINVDHLLQLVSHEWRDEQLRRDNHLLDAFRAGDVNGDGQLTSAEFSQIVLSIDHARDLGDILLMYSETLRRTECDHINTEVFLQVAKEYELDRVVWNEDGDLRNIVNDISDLDKTWRNIRCFFLGTLEALSRDLISNHFLRVCEGAGCGCLKCILDGYIGFQRMRRDFVVAAQEQGQQQQGGLVARSPYAVSESLVWARYWHLMRQIYEAAAESDGILTPWEGSDYIRVDPAPSMQPRLVSSRRLALPNILFPDTNRISARMSVTHDPEVFDADAINAQFASLLDHMVYKKPDATDSS